jgi:hypothetical protein
MTVKSDVFLREWMKPKKVKKAVIKTRTFSVRKIYIRRMR